MANGFPENPLSKVVGLDGPFDHSNLHQRGVERTSMGGVEGLLLNLDENAVTDMREKHVISNILSMDFESWDESFTSTQSLAKLLRKTEPQQGSHGTSSSWKIQNNNQSRFSFAREEEFISHANNVEPDAIRSGNVLNEQSFGNNFLDNRNLNHDKFIKCNGFTSVTGKASDSFSCSSSQSFTSKLSASRAQLSAPPGFLAPSRPPPPGFTTHERIEQPFDNMPFHRLNTSPLLRNQYSPRGNIGDSVDIEFMDPAILAVGKGRHVGGLDGPSFELRSNFPQQSRPLESEANLQLLLQKSLALHQNQRFTDMGDNFLHHNHIPSRIMEQTLGNNLSPFLQPALPQARNALAPNGHGKNWNEVQSGHNLGMAELLGTGSLGINKFYTGYDDSKMRMPNSSDLYNRTFGF